MDVADFESWLGWIASLTFHQRRRTWLALALSEASDKPADESTVSQDFTMASIDLATPCERSVAMDLPAALASSPIAAEGVAELGQRRVDRVGCPHCDGREVVRWGQSADLPRYRCKTCRRTFNALTKTPLAGLRHKEKWATQAGAMIDGVSMAKAAKRCGVHYTTAFRWRHRFLDALATDTSQTLPGIIGGDEMVILESFKGKRSAMPRKARKRGGKLAK